MKRIKYTLLFSLLVTASLFAQDVTVYSRYGFGMPIYGFSARNSSLANTGSAFLERQNISVLNPASLTGLETTRFEFGTVFNNAFLKDNSGSSMISKGAFTGFTAGFPIYQPYGIGLSIGVVPFTIVNYETVQKGFSSETNSDYSLTSLGQGGISKIFIGTSVKPAADFSFGASLNYYFGKTTYSSTLSFVDENVLETEFNKTFRARAVGFDVGVISPDLSRLMNDSLPVQDIRFGVSLEYVNQFTSDSLYSGGNSIVNDTITYGSGNYKVPLRLNFGVSAKIGKQFRSGVDFSLQDWTKFTIGDRTPENLVNSYRISWGIEYTEEVNKGWEPYRLRGGISYWKTPFAIAGTQINELTVSAGYAFPIGYASTADFSLQFVTRGTTEANLIKENIIRINFGLSLGEIWFIQQER